MKRTIQIFFGILAAAALTVGLIYQPQTDKDNRSDNFWLVCLAVTGIALLGFLWLNRDDSKIKPNLLPPEERLRHNIQRVSSVIIVGFLLISFQLLREQLVAADNIEKPFNGVDAKGNPVSVEDPRLVTEALANQRGRIFDSAGNQIAGIQVSKYGLVKRTYAPNSPTTQLLGYFSPTIFGNSGLEASYDDYLSGKSGNAFAGLQNDLLHEPTVGNDLYLTIDPTLQQVAYNALGQTNGSIVLLDGKTGAVLAMVGYPNFDPSTLVFDPTVDDSLWPQEIKDIQTRWDAYNNPKGNQPLLVRPTSGLYIPGSIFKTITLSGMLETGRTQPTSTWQDPGYFIINSHRIEDPNRPDKNITTWTSQQGYMFSLNAVFAQMGVQMGGQSLDDYTSRFGFGKDLPFDLPTAQSQSHNSGEPDYLSNPVAQAETGFGQGEILMTPLHAALVAAAIGRGDGVLPKPYLVQQIKTRDGGVIQQTQPSTWLQAIQPQTANTVRDIMIASATDGWVGLEGGNLSKNGAVVGGKTGTAENGNNVENAWYIAWATKGDRLFAVAALVDHKVGGEGLSDAMPKANKVLTAALAEVK